MVNMNCICPACLMVVSQGKAVEHIRECHPEIAENIAKAVQKGIELSKRAREVMKTTKGA